MRKIIAGILSGAIVGVIDVVPMVIQKLPCSAGISAFSMWVVTGFLVVTSSLKLPYVLKSMLISILILAVCTPLIGRETVLVPILPITIVLGALLGWMIGKFENKKKYNQ